MKNARRWRLPRSAWTHRHEGPPGALRLERRGRIAILTLDNQSKGNAISREMLVELGQATVEIENDRELRAAVLTGAGARAFCTGADISAWGGMDSVDFSRQWIRAGHFHFDRLARLPIPLIAAINGAASGGGLELAALCDVRVAAPEAVFGLPEAGIGVTPGWSGAQRLGRLLPQALLREMALTGGRLDAERLREVGFINEIASDPLARALEIAERAAALGPRAVETTRLVLNAAIDEGREAAIDALAGGLAASTADKAEGVASFREKRKPDFRGK
jgi:enoyl-CoA hydratase/carnithine racemase